MNKEDIIRMARDVGFVAYGEDAGEYRIPTPAFHGRLERFAALVAAASEEQWKHAVINELVCCHIYNAAHDSDPRKALHDAISWNVQVALDPQVSSDAQALIDRGAAAEREACAKVVDDWAHSGVKESWWRNVFSRVAAAIRARGQA